MINHSVAEKDAEELAEDILSLLCNWVSIHCTDGAECNGGCLPICIDALGIASVSVLVCSGASPEKVRGLGELFYLAFEKARASPGSQDL